MFCMMIDCEDNVHAYEIDEFITRCGENLQFLDPEPPAPETNLDTIIHDAWAKFNSGTSDDFMDFRDAFKEAIERALPKGGSNE